MKWNKKAQQSERNEHSNASRKRFVTFKRKRERERERERKREKDYNQSLLYAYTIVFERVCTWIKCFVEIDRHFMKKIAKLVVTAGDSTSSLNQKIPTHHNFQQFSSW